MKRSRSQIDARRSAAAKRRRQGSINRYRAMNRGVRPAPRRAGFARRAGYYGRYPPSGGELKFHDVTMDSTNPVPTAGEIHTSMNLIAQGVGESNRVGRKCRIKKISIRGEAVLNNSTNYQTASDTVRMIVFLDTQCNGANAVVTDILESADYQSFNNLANSQRFKILSDKTVTLNAQAAEGNGTAEGTCNYTLAFQYHKQCDIPIEFNNTTGAITEIRSNNLSILYISGNGYSYVAANARLRFADY